MYDIKFKSSQINEIVLLVKINSLLYEGKQTHNNKFKMFNCPQRHTYTHKHKGKKNYRSKKEIIESKY